MKRNYSDLIKSKEQRTLTAKGNRFLWRCIDVIAENKGLNRYSNELKETKDKFKNIIYFLIIDKGMSISEITELIKSRKFIESN